MEYHNEILNSKSLGVERSAMSAELGKLKKEGTIDFHRNHFTLKDKTAKEDLK